MYIHAVIEDYCGCSTSINYVIYAISDIMHAGSSTTNFLRNIAEILIMPAGISTFQFLMLLPGKCYNIAL